MSKAWSISSVSFRSCPQVLFTCIEVSSSEICVEYRPYTTFQNKMKIFKEAVRRGRFSTCLQFFIVDQDHRFGNKNKNNVKKEIYTTIFSAGFSRLGLASNLKVMLWISVDDCFIQSSLKYVCYFLKEFYRAFPQIYEKASG